jgi:hypothetical protein
VSTITAPTRSCPVLTPPTDRCLSAPPAADERDESADQDQRWSRWSDARGVAERERAASCFRRSTLPVRLEATSTHLLLRPMNPGSCPSRARDRASRGYAILISPRSASLTALSLGKTFATSGSKTTTLLSAVVRAAYLPRIKTPSGPRSGDPGADG